jgi:predicted enzyme related to lactoylglutathione lyase
LPAKRETTIAPVGIELSLEVEDVDATWRAWQAKGVQTLSAPQDFPFGRAFDAQDPEGHLLNIYKLRTS